MWKYARDSEFEENDGNTGVYAWTQEVGYTKGTGDLVNASINAYANVNFYCSGLYKK